MSSSVVVRTADPRDAHPDLLDSRLLDDAERAQWKRFRFERNRLEYLVAHVLARRMLSQLGGLEPAEWRFEIGEKGRPEIAPRHGSELRFNLSHTDGLVAVAVTRGADVGVDVECHTRPGETVKLASRYFSEAECAGLFALPEAEQRGRFFDLWTLKESYIKARGLGLHLPLDQFALDPSERSRISVAFEGGIDDDPDSWWFWLRDEGDAHRLALAVRTGGGPVSVDFGGYAG